MSRFTVTFFLFQESTLIIDSNRRVPRAVASCPKLKSPGRYTKEGLFHRKNRVISLPLLHELELD